MTHIDTIRAALEQARELVPEYCGIRTQYDAALAALAELETELAECAKHCGAYKAEAEKWESAYDDCEDALIGEQTRDNFGDGESIADCARRVLRERDELRARLAAIDAAPTVGWIADSGELIARPEAK